MMTFMGEKKRLLNIHEQKYTDLAVFQVNITVFQANTNASLKNLQIQVRQLALAMQNQSKVAFPSDKEESEGLYGGNSKKWKGDRKQKRRREEKDLKS